MIALYRILFLPLFLLALPYYLYRMCKRGGYARDFTQRLGNFPRLPEKKPGHPRIWLQAVSVGEVLAAGALIKELKAQLTAEIVLTTTTSTGYAQARQRYQNDCLKVGLFPFDFLPLSHRTWNRINPDLAITMESELWPEHIQQAQKRSIPVFVVNARLSDRSFQRYRKLGKCSRTLLNKLTHIYAGNQADAKRLIKLGLPPERIETFGNLKFDVAPASKITPTERSELRQSLGFPSDNDAHPVLLGSSTWPSEEALLLDIQRQAIAKGIDCRLLLVPRHAERRAEIIKQLQAQDLPYHIRSTARAALEGTRIHLADTTGELARLTEAADLAFIGKSMPPNKGGQTPIEAAALGLPIVFGPHMENFKEVVRSLLEQGAALQVSDSQSLQETLIDLITNPTERKELSGRARQWHGQNCGSSQRIARDIAKRMK